MLVLLSDIHFTDASLSAGDNIPARAFAYLAEDIKGIIENEDVEGHRRLDVKDVEIVLLGDVFDVIRSTRWDALLLPWSTPGDKLEDRTDKILKGVLETNAGALEEIRNLRTSLGVPARITYVAGNHDRLVNMFERTRGRVADKLGLSAEECDPARPFPTEYRSADYAVVARHGQQFDSLNWGGGFDRPSLGEAVVVKLINAFPRNLKEKLGENPGEAAEHVLERIAELDHVRPLWAVPRWVRSVIKETSDPGLGEAIGDAWKEAVTGFLADGLVRRHTGGFHPFKLTWWLPTLLKMPWGLAERVFEWKWVRNLLGSNDRKFVKKAAADPALSETRSAPADLVVYGHTHNALQEPLDVRGERRLVYFNSGTWRKTVRPAEHGKGGRDFIPWEVMSYLILYKESENRGYRYEMWEGMRGK
ncbi:MAG: hypothetical protein ACYTGB_06320 [Planctomycetota bacterium]|jgi:UDP-2,3-diacylglucosamine pyrophosphatase LpxH